MARTLRRPPMVGGDVVRRSEVGLFSGAVQRGARGSNPRPTDSVTVIAAYLIIAYNQLSYNIFGR
jgi:hypothetical protein